MLFAGTFVRWMFGNLNCETAQVMQVSRKRAMSLPRWNVRQGGQRNRIGGARLQAKRPFVVLTLDVIIGYFRRRAAPIMSTIRGVPSEIVIGDTRRRVKAVCAVDLHSMATVLKVRLNDAAGCNSEDNINQLRFAEIDVPVVQQQECDCRVRSSPLVSVDERVVAAEVEEVSRRHCWYGLVQVTAFERRRWNCDSGFQGAGIAEAVRSTIEGDLLSVYLDYLIQREE